jgi:hypothetical protein
MSLLSAACSAAEADAQLHQATEALREAQAALERVTASHKRAHDTLAEWLGKECYACTDAVVKRAKAMADESCRSDQLYDVATGVSTDQWVYDVDVDECHQDDCPNSDLCGAYVNIFSSEKCCDVCFENDFATDAVVPSLKELLGDEDDYEPADDAQRFEWHKLGPNTGKVVCCAPDENECKEAPAYRCRGAAYVLCATHFAQRYPEK